MKQKKTNILVVIQKLSKYVWWEKYDSTDIYLQYRIIANAMCLANNDEDMEVLLSLPKQYLIDAIKFAQAGWFDKKSWSYWHYALGLTNIREEVPPLMKRGFQK